MKEVSCSKLTLNLSREGSALSFVPIHPLEVGRPPGEAGRLSWRRGHKHRLPLGQGLTTSAQHSTLFIVVPGNLRRWEEEAAAGERFGASPEPVQSPRYI